MEKELKKEPCPKFDDSKTRYDLIPINSLKKLAEVYEFGAAKYFEESWRKGLSWKRIYGAAMRHLYSSLDGEDIDKESGLLHLAQCAWNCFTLINFLLNQIGIDDRVKNLDNLDLKLMIIEKQDVEKQLKMFDERIKERIKMKENETSSEKIRWKLK